MAMKKILIIANFNRNYSKQDYGRFIQIANNLSDSYEVEIVTSDFDHLTKAKAEETHINWPFKITKLKEIGYPKNVCLKRFVSHYLWGKEVRKYLRESGLPDLIYCAVPSLTGPSEAIRYAKEKNIPVIVDIQDLWPEAFKMAINIPIFSDILFFPFEIKANEIYRNANDIIAVSDTYLQRAKRVNSKVELGHVVFLGSRLSDFDRYVEEYKTERDDQSIRLAYCGTLGSSYDITCVIDALSIIKKRGINPPEFIVMGSGPRLDEFKQYATEKNVKATFTGRLPYPEMCGLLCSCDIAVNPISKGAAQSIINKHADYAASGLPIINTQENKEYRNLITTYNMGFNCENNDPDDMAEKIICLMNDDMLRSEMGKNSRKCAEERFNKDKTYAEITETVNMLI